MTGLDDDEDGPENFRPPPHPDDRLWRHPSEIAAMHAAQANAETAKVPAIKIGEDSQADSRSRIHFGLLVAAGAVAVGATALSLGVVSSRGESQVAESQPESVTVPLAISEADAAESEQVDTPIDDVVAQAPTQGEVLLTQRLHDEVATSLSRVQAATPTGMREGGGLFVTSEGHIATSAGLVHGAEYVLVWTDDGRRWKADVLASDPFSDVAVLKINSDDWPAVSLGADEMLWAGQYAFAVDHNRRTMRIGEVTSVAAAVGIESLAPIANGLASPEMAARVVVEQPAALPGSAIVDDTGVVIAMMSSEHSSTHATPAWMLERVALDLITTGAATHTWMGVAAESSSESRMAIVTEVFADSPALAAGLRSGDLIDSIGGETITSADGLWRYVQASRPGDDVVLAVTRHGSRRLVVVTLAELPTSGD